MLLVVDVKINYLLGMEFDICWLVICLFANLRFVC